MRPLSSSRSLEIEWWQTCEFQYRQQVQCGSPDCRGPRRRIFQLLGVRKASAEGRFNNPRSIYGWAFYSKPISDCLFDRSPVPLLGYYNPLLAYGEKKAVGDAKEVGCNDFIMVDFPPEEAKDFRDLRASEGWSSAPSRLQRKY